LHDGQAAPQAGKTARLDDGSVQHPRPAPGAPESTPELLPSDSGTRAAAGVPNPRTVLSRVGATAGGAQATGWRGLGGWWSLLAAFAAGLALAGTFPPVGFWPLAIAGPALLMLAVWRKRLLATFGLALTCGLVFFFALLSWLVNVAWYAWTALAIAEALSFALVALALPFLLRLRAWPLAVAGWWVLQESVHARYPWGFPWGRLAMSQAAAPTAGWVAVGGPVLLTFLLALAGASVAYLIIAAPAAIRSGWRPVIAAVIVPGVALGAVLAGNLVWSPATGHAPSSVIATVQGNVPHARNLPNLLRATTVTVNHAAATIDFAGQIAAGRRPPPAVVIWPENSTDIDPAQSRSTYKTIELAVDAIRRPILVGAVLSHPQRNSGQLWLPGRGPTQVYIKRQLVPFGEVIPMRGLLSTFTSLPSLQPHNFTPGHRAVVFHFGRIRLGDLICYEVGFDNLARSEIAAGANLLGVQTNDADFELDGQLGESLQQLEMARIDAITTGRAVAVASTTGLSAIIAPDGSIIKHSRTWQRAVLEARVPLLTGLTPAVRAGGWPEGVIVVLTLVSLAWAIGTAWRRPAIARGLGGGW
jgi:apolipoprotein N-acyltransferase